VFEMTERKYARPTISRTFEGRDRFAPAAGWLAKGVDLSTFGRSAGAVHQLHIPTPTATGDLLSGEVLRVDRFGNLVTNIDRKLFDQFVHSSGIEIAAATNRIGRVVGTYADAAMDEVCALFGSTDHLEIAVNAGSARDRLNLTRGAPVTIRRT